MTDKFAGPLAQGVSEHVTIALGFGPWLLNETLFRVVGRPRDTLESIFRGADPTLHHLGVRRGPWDLSQPPLGTSIFIGFSIFS